MASRPFDRRSVFAPLALLVGLFASGCSGDVQSNPGPSEANPIDAEESAVIAGLNKLRAGAGITTPFIAPLVRMCCTSARCRSLSVCGSGRCPCL